MTTIDLKAVETLERQRQADVARQAGRNGGVYDRLLGRWIDWNEDGPKERPA